MKAKYKVGDYLVAPQIKFLEIVAVIEGRMPIYAVRMPHNPPKHGMQVNWQTEYQVEEHDAKLGKPDFAPYRKLAADDVLKVSGDENDDAYSRILARVGDMVLLSQVPHKHIEGLTDLAEQLRELTDGELDLMGSLSKDTKTKVRQHTSLTHQNKLAATWMHIDEVCLFNWPIVGE